MACRSARIWHGWKLSVSALMTGTSLAEARAASRSWPNVRQAIAATWRLSTRAVSSTVSPRPSCVLWDSMTSGLPPRSATPVANETRVRSDGLSNITATVCGPASGLRANRSAFSSAARSSTSACSAGFRSSSRRKCRGGQSAAGPPPGPPVVPAPRSCGTPGGGDVVKNAGQGAEEVSYFPGADDQWRRQPDRVRLHRVDQVPGAAGGRFHVARRRPGPARRPATGPGRGPRPAADGLSRRCRWPAGYPPRPR